jgi:hypothetical protein
MRLLLLTATAAAAFAASVAGQASAAGSGPGRFTLYSSGARGEWINMSDDRGRGEGNNPFGNVAGSVVPTQASERLAGPLAGDEGDYAYTLSTSRGGKDRAGSSLYICHYNFNKGAFCDASFQLKDGTLIAKGSYNFDDSAFTLSIVGGTRAYRGAKGVIDVKALGSSTQPQPVFRAVPMLQAQRATFTVKPAAKGTHGLVAYTRPLDQAFIDNTDSSGLGSKNNPFGTRQKAPGQAGSEAADGPFPGDEALYSFAVYRDASLTHKLGTAVYTCVYAFDKNGICNASFQLDTGTLIGTGTLDFTAPAFELAMTGGAGQYAGAVGDLRADPSGKQAQRLVFTLGRVS